jgi:hypothetical protein
MQVQQVNLGAVTYRDLEGNPVQGSIVLQPFASRVLVADGAAGAAAQRRKSENRTFMNACSTPFNPMVRIRLLGADAASVEIFDIRGLRAACLTPKAGAWEVVWNPGGHPGGVYCVRVRTPKKILLTRVSVVR